MWTPCSSSDPHSPQASASPNAVAVMTCTSHTPGCVLGPPTQTLGCTEDYLVPFCPCWHPSVPHTFGCGPCFLAPDTTTGKHFVQCQATTTIEKHVPILVPCSLMTIDATTCHVTRAAFKVNGCSLCSSTTGVHHSRGLHSSTLRAQHRQSGREHEQQHAFDRATHLTSMHVNAHHTKRGRVHVATSPPKEAHID